MNFIKKLLILTTVIISLAIIWKLIMIRIKLKKEIEGFFDTPDSELYNNKSVLQISLNDSNAILHDLPLRELCIKSSYNSACCGSFISLDMLSYVISRGVRYLDFEVFYVPSETNSKIFIPAVATSVDPTFMVLNTNNNILLDTVLTRAISNAFTSQYCPNYNEPLFINLRVKSNNSNIYAEIAASLDNTVKSKLYNDPNDSSSQVYIGSNSPSIFYKAKSVTKDTLLKNILGKVIISFDKTVFLNYQNYSFTCNNNSSSSCYDLKNYINIENGSQNLNLNNYNLITKSPLIQINDDNLTTNVKSFTCVNPDNKSTQNPKYRDYILKYGGCQIVPYRFYMNDTNLADYESFFNVNSSAFVPLGIAISQYMKNYE